MRTITIATTENATEMAAAATGKAGVFPSVAFVWYKRKKKKSVVSISNLHVFVCSCQQLIHF